MDFEGIKKVCVVGHSYGSFLASRLNLKHRCAGGVVIVMGTGALLVHNSGVGGTAMAPSWQAGSPQAQVSSDKWESPSQCDWTDSGVSLNV
jgi:pimeloyl-ACP methyl ester carboxylesterase